VKHYEYIDPNAIDKAMKVMAKAIEELKERRDHYKGMSEIWFREVQRLKKLLPDNA